MQWLIFWLVYPLLWLLSRLPFWLFYKVSDLVYILIYYIVGYRKKTVRFNLKTAFPDKSEADLKQIEKKFYKHMVDMFLEMIKSISISAAELKKRFELPDLAIIDKLAKERRSSIIVMGHYASYEWLTALQFYFDHSGYGIYKRIKNKYFDNIYNHYILISHTLFPGYDAKTLARSRLFVHRLLRLKLRSYSRI